MIIDAGSAKVAAGTENIILAAMREAERENIAAHPEPVDLRYGDLLFQLEDEIDYAYFPDSGMCSLLSVTEEGHIVEIGMVGNDGVIGVPLVMGITRTPYQIMVQAEGTGKRLKAAIFKAEFDRGGSLHDLVLRYAYTLIAQISQSAVCNRFHTVRQRLCR